MVGGVRSLPGVAQIDALSRRDAYALGGSLPGTALVVSGGVIAKEVGTVTVYRVEGGGNQRLFIDANGNVEISSLLTYNGRGPVRNLYLNFGAGHVPDTTWTGSPQPYRWLDLSPRGKSSLGGQAAAYPVGYQPTGFIFELP